VIRPSSRRARALSFPIALAVSVTSSAASAQVLYFQDVVDPFPDQQCGGEGCWTNYLRLSDVDGDGDLDAVFPNASGFFSDPGAQPLEIYLNDGTGQFDAGTSTLLGEAVSGAYRVVAIGDVNGDTRSDIFLPSASGGVDRLFIQDAFGGFTDQAAARIGTSSRSAATRFGDLDGDGDLDLLIGAGYASPDSPPARLYLNDAEGVFTEALGALPTTIAGTDPTDVDLADIDGDFDLDIYVDAHSGDNALWLNDGSGVFTDVSARLPPLDPSAQFHYGPAACDIDGDGDRDILVDNIAGSYGEEILVNDGAGNFTAEGASRITGNVANADDNGIVCLDFDGDGDNDFIVMALSTNAERLFVNDGTGNFTRATGAFSTVSDPTLWMEAGDVNGDGRLDIVTAQGEGSPQNERLYLGTDEVAVDVSAPEIFAHDMESFWPEVRFALQDAATSDEGPRILGAEAQLPNAESPVPATFMGGDLYRVVVPEGTTDFSLCATDLAGNFGCIELTHGGGAGGGGAGGGGGQGEGGFPQTTSIVASSSSGTESAATGSSSSASGPAGSTGPGGVGGGDDAILDDDGGCGCEVAGAPSSSRPLLASIGLALAALFARRKPRASRGLSRDEGTNA